MSQYNKDTNRLDNREIIDSFIEQYISGAQGCEMDCDAAKSLAEALKDMRDNRVVEYEWDTWDQLYPFSKFREDLEITMHHVLTEPVCPTVKISGEISGNTIAHGSGNTMTEALNEAMQRAIMRLKGNDDG